MKLIYRIQLKRTGSSDHEQKVSAEHATDEFGTPADVLGELFGQPGRWEEFFHTGVVKSVLENYYTMHFTKFSNFHF